MSDQADIDALNEDIVALKPQSATVDGNSVTDRTVSDKIKARNDAAAQATAAAGPGHFGLRFSKLIPPGCG